MIRSAGKTNNSAELLISNYIIQIKASSSEEYETLATSKFNMKHILIQTIKNITLLVITLTVILPIPMGIHFVFRIIMAVLSHKRGNRILSIHHKGIGHSE